MNRQNKFEKYRVEKEREKLVKKDKKYVVNGLPCEICYTLFKTLMFREEIEKNSSSRISIRDVSTTVCANLFYFEKEQSGFIS